MDDADRASDQQELAMKVLMSRIDAARQIEPTGMCFNCEHAVGPTQLYCDDECAAEHAWYLRRKE